MFSSTFVAIAPTFAFCEYAPKLCKWFEIWMTPPKNLSLNPPCVLQIDYLITEVLRYFSCVRGKILAERFPVPLLAGCLLWCDRRSLSVQGRRRCEALGMFTATILKQYIREDSSDCSSSHITVWTLLSSPFIQHVSPKHTRCNILVCTVFRYPTTCKCKHWGGGDSVTGQILFFG